MKILNVLRGIGGEFEFARVSVAIGGLFAVLTPIGFEIWEMGWKGGHFDVTAWCLAYPGGLIALFGCSGAAMRDALALFFAIVVIGLLVLILREHRPQQQLVLVTNAAACVPPASHWQFKQRRIA
jgi:predicted signal transduction protein with EAL and GGDEF domain